MQALAAPIGGRQKRRLHLGPDRRAGLVVVVVEGMGTDLFAEVAAVLRQLLFRQDFRPAHEFAVHPAALAAFAGAVLHGFHLHVVPVFPERAENPAVVGHVAVPVGGAFPDAHGGQVRRLEAGDVPLIDAVIGNAVEPDLAVRPGLRRGPFDAVVKILGLARRKMVDVAGRAAAAARVNTHAGIVVRHPFLRIDDLPVLIQVAGAGGDVGVLLGHALPGARIAVLEGKTFGVGAVGEDHRVASVLDGAEHIGAQHEAVVHLDRDVPFDAHVVAHLGAVLVGFAGSRYRRARGRWHRDLPEVSCGAKSVMAAPSRLGLAARRAAAAPEAGLGFEHGADRRGVLLGMAAL